MSRWSEPNDEQPGRRIPKSRDRPAPILPIEIGAALDLRYRLAVFAEPRAEFALDNFTLQYGEKTSLAAQRLTLAQSDHANRAACSRAQSTNLLGCLPVNCWNVSRIAG